MANMRDMSKKQFDKAAKRNGFTPDGFMGYYDLGIEGQKCSASVMNAGPNRRARLAYLLKTRDEILKTLETRKG